MKSIILAAGAAKRLAPLANSIPKCLIEIGSKPILEYQLDAISYYGINEVAIVIGYLKEKIINEYGNRYKNLNIIYIENPDFASTNTLYSLWLAREYFRNEDFLYFNADVLFHHKIIGRILKSMRASILAVEIKGCGEEEVKVIPGLNERIVRIGKKINLSKSIGEFIGVGKFSASLSTDFIKSIGELIDMGDKMAFFEKAVDRILSKHNIYYEDITGTPVIEIDFPEDLERARNEILDRLISSSP